MKYLFMFMIMVIICPGCILVSDAKYQADAAMWQAKSDASRAWAIQANKPLARSNALLETILKGIDRRVAT